jgi:hypothetical protein
VWAQTSQNELPTSSASNVIVNPESNASRDGR